MASYKSSGCLAGGDYAIDIGYAAYMTRWLRLSAMILPAIVAVGLCNAGKSFAQARDYPFDLSILDRIDTAPEFGGQLATPNGTKRGARKVFNYILDTRATDLSKEGADIATDKDSELSSETTAFYRDQMRRDGLHWQVVSLTARLASELGRPDANHTDTIGYLNNLRSLVGETNAEILVNGLTGRNMEHEKQEMAAARQLDLPTMLDLEDNMMAPALDADQILGSVRHDLERYNSTTKGRRAANKVTYTGLQIAGFVPTIIAPIAQTTLFGLVMANGGSEQDKLLKELYYAKRFEKRQELIQKELTLALEARQTAIATKNATLFCFARELARHLCREHVPSSLFPSTVATAKSQIE